MTLLWVYIIGAIIAAGLVIYSLATDRDIQTGKSKVNPFTSIAYIVLWPAVILVAIFVAIRQKNKNEEE